MSALVREAAQIAAEKLAEARRADRGSKPDK